MGRGIIEGLTIIGLVASCTVTDTDTGEATEPGTGFELLEMSDRTIEAVVRGVGDELQLLVVETEDGVVDLTYDFGDTVIALSIDHNQGVGDFLPSGAALDVAERRLLDDSVAAIAELIPKDEAERTQVQDTANRIGQLLQIVPVGEALVEGSFQSERGWRHISGYCQRQYIGSGYYRTAGKGCGCTGGSGRGCKGRCGQGCGGTSYPRCYGWTAYTRDCAKHDYGLGSWWSASDDFSFASNNRSCGGNCY